MKICAICGYPAQDGKETCCDRCAKELDSRNASKVTNRKKASGMNKETYKSTSETTSIVLENFARALLKNGIPCFTSNVDIDREICSQDEWFKKLDQSYRRRCITDNIEMVGYERYSKSNGGKSVYHRTVDPDVLRARLVSFIPGGE